MFWEARLTPGLISIRIMINFHRQEKALEKSHKTDIQIN
jgi:hypothetical protein